MSSQVNDAALTAADFEAIRSLIYSYATFVDSGEPHSVGKLFARGRFVIDGSPVVAEGEAEVSRIFERSILYYGDGTPRTQHLTSNLSMRLGDSPDEVRAGSYVVVMQSTPTMLLQPIMTAEYEDLFRREAGSWYFAERRLRFVLEGDTRQHLRRPVDTFRHARDVDV